MLQIRRNVFETNSSSTHSIVLCLKKDYNLFKSGAYYYIDSCRLDKKFVTWDELVDIVKNNKILVGKNVYYDMIKYKEQGNEEDLEELLKDWSIYTYDSYFDNEYESYFSQLTTPSGEDICAFGFYGESY